MELSDATVLVTGSNRGLGRELVTALVSAGAKKIYATAREPSAVSDLVDGERVAAGNGGQVLVDETGLEARFPEGGPDGGLVGFVGQGFFVGCDGFWKALERSVSITGAYPETVVGLGGDGLIVGEETELVLALLPMVYA